MYHVLSRHPEVRLPPRKEIGYLWEKRFLPNRNYTSPFFDKHWYYRGIRTYIFRSFRNHMKPLRRRQLNLPKLLWDIRYAFLPHTDSWYSGLFDNQHVSGDITPKYSELSEADLVEFRKSFGTTKILITLRDPIDREWSRAKMNLCKRQNRQPSEVGYDEWINHFDDDEQSKANDYAALYSRWAGVFGRENVCVIFYDEIENDGWIIYQKICAFLGLTQPSISLKDTVLAPKHVGIVSLIPKDLHEYLFLKHRKTMACIADTFPEHAYPKEWIEKHEAKLRDNKEP